MYVALTFPYSLLFFLSNHSISGNFVTSANSILTLKEEGGVFFFYT
jgi:hypothetical protein